MVCVAIRTPRAPRGGDRDAGRRPR
jgi:hypothetical protein